MNSVALARAPLTPREEYPVLDIVQPFWLTLFVATLLVGEPDDTA